MFYSIAINGVPESYSYAPVALLDPKGQEVSGLFIYDLDTENTDSTAQIVMRMDNDEYVVGEIYLGYHPRWDPPEALKDYVLVVRSRSDTHGLLYEERLEPTVPDRYGASMQCTTMATYWLGRFITARRPVELLTTPPGFTEFETAIGLAENYQARKRASNEEYMKLVKPRQNKRSVYKVR